MTSIGKFQVDKKLLKTELNQLLVFVNAIKLIENECFDDPEKFIKKHGLYQQWILQVNPVYLYIICIIVLDYSAIAFSLEYDDHFDGFVNLDSLQPLFATQNELVDCRKVLNKTIFSSIFVSFLFTSEKESNLIPNFIVRWSHLFLVFCSIFSLDSKTIQNFGFLENRNAFPNSYRRTTQFKLDEIAAKNLLCIRESNGWYTKLYEFIYSRDEVSCRKREEEDKEDNKSILYNKGSFYFFQMVTLGLDLHLLSTEEIFEIVSKKMWMNLLK